MLKRCLTPLSFLSYNNTANFFILNVMSLLSQKDRINVIKSLDFYLFNKGQDMNETERAELNALLNWIKLEYDKNEN
jgi:hypothetical protein